MSSRPDQLELVMPGDRLGPFPAGNQPEAGHGGGSGVDAAPGLWWRHAPPHRPRSARPIPDARGPDRADACAGPRARCSSRAWRSLARAGDAVDIVARSVGPVQPQELADQDRGLGYLIPQHSAPPLADRVASRRADSNGCRRRPAASPAIVAVCALRSTITGPGQVERREHDDICRHRRDRLRVPRRGRPDRLVRARPDPAPRAAPSCCSGHDSTTATRWRPSPGLPSRPGRCSCSGWAQTAPASSCSATTSWAGPNNPLRPVAGLGAGAFGDDPSGRLSAQRDRGGIGVHLAQPPGRCTR